MSKILSVVSLIILSGTLYFGIQNHQQTKQKIAELKAEKETLLIRSKELAGAKGRNTEIELSIAKVEIDLESDKTNRVDLLQKIAQGESDLQQLRVETKKVASKLKNAPIKDFEGISDKQKTMAAIRLDIETADVEVARLEAERTVYSEGNTKLIAAATALKGLRTNQSAGIITGDFRSTIIKAYNQWGFVIIKGGNDDGVVQHANLNVYRNDRLLAGLMVTHVGPDQSAAEIIPGSVTKGLSLAVGDVVLKASAAQQPVEISTSQSSTTNESL